MKRLYEYFKDTRIFFRLACSILFVFIAFIVLAVINYMNLTSERQDAVFNMIRQSNQQAIEKIDDYLIDVMNITKLPLSYKEKDMRYLNELDKFNATNKASIPFQRINESMFEDMMIYKENINSCYIYNLNGVGDYKTRDPIYGTGNVSEEAWFQEAILAAGKPIIIDTQILQNSVEKEKTIFEFGIARGIMKIESASVIGVLRINTNIDYLAQICKNIKITPNHRVMILNDNSIIYDTNTENIGKSVFEEVQSIDWKLFQTPLTLEVEKKNYLASSVISNVSDWYMVSLIPEEELFKELRATQMINLFLTCTISFITLILIFFITRQIVKPIEELVKLMKIVEEGEFNIKIEVKSRDEIGALSHSFNSMISKINNLIQEVYLEQIHQKELELQMLQAQINPHFLYNTLESISMMAIIHDDRTTSQMVTNLGSILRYSISNYNEEVTLKEEIAHLNQYIYLQKVRFEEAYKIEINIDDALNEVKILKMILQPIVENAIYHGMRNLRTGGKIIVSAYQASKEEITFEITDNGTGICKEEIEQLNDYIQGKNDCFRSIGLKNVNKRIKLKYGEDCGVVVRHHSQVGTIVSVSINITHT